jgi:hypothetical protein
MHLTRAAAAAAFLFIAGSAADAQAVSQVPYVKRSAQTVEVRTDSGAPQPVPLRIIDSRGDTGPLQFSAPAGANAVRGGEEDRASAAGIIGAQLWKPNRYYALAAFNFADPGAIEGEEAAFGWFVLNPSLEQHSFHLEGNAALLGVGFFRLGLYGRGGVSFAKMSAIVPDGSPDGQLQSERGEVYYGSVGLQLATKEALVGDQAQNVYQAGFEVGPSGRVFSGDIAQNDALRLAAIGIDDTKFRGTEVTFFLRVNTVVPYVRFTRMPDDDVRSLSGPQTYLGLKVVGSMFTK